MRFVLLVLLSGCSAVPRLASMREHLHSASQAYESAVDAYTRACLPEPLPALDAPCARLSAALYHSRAVVQGAADALDR